MKYKDQFESKKVFNDETPHKFYKLLLRNGISHQFVKDEKN